ncbi:hypothetical protein [Methanoculleus sp.]|uniref:hypothetical protein n=1 Tax=Methanoculleus sp. TaxID=90427 RepID=UPI0025CD0A4F|nr:hypothetical protein [Methanoculleus sp.]
MTILTMALVDPAAHVVLSAAASSFELTLRADPEGFAPDPLGLASSPAMTAMTAVFSRVTATAVTERTPGEMGILGMLLDMEYVQVHVRTYTAE